MPSDDEDCLECESVLEALEEIDDEADMYGIDFVKSDDEHTAKTVGGVFSTPALVYFRKGIPLVYDGIYIPVLILFEFRHIYIRIPVFSIVSQSKKSTP